MPTERKPRKKRKPRKRRRPRKIYKSVPTSKELSIEFQLHDGGQLEFVQDRTRFKVAVCGRRWGKTVGGVADVCADLLQHGFPRRALWVAPTYDQTNEAVTVIMEGLGETGAVVTYNRSKHVITFYGGGQLFFRSGEIPRRLRSRGWDVVVIDEAAFIPDQVWRETLRPALADRQGRGIFLSTPCGAHGWFYHEFQRGLDPAVKDVKSWRFPTWTNPIIAPEEIEHMRATMPERVFAQEIAAEFVTGDGAVFAVIPQADYDVPRSPSGNVVVGCDVAKLHDYTVLVALDETGRLVDFKRMNQLEYTRQVEIIAGFARRWNAAIYVDATGVGQAVLDMLKSAGLNVRDFTFTRESKRQLVENLVVALERGDIVLPRSGAETLLAELRVFSATATAAGLRYSAPDGLHDDCVMALALAAWGQAEGDRVWVFSV